MPLTFQDLIFYVVMLRVVYQYEGSQPLVYQW